MGGESKDKRFVVDYAALAHHRKKAIDIYDEREQKEIIDAQSFPDEELRELEEAHAVPWALLQQHELTDMSDSRRLLRCVLRQDLRFDFMLAFKRLTGAQSPVRGPTMPLEFMGDYNALAEINVLAGKHFRDQRLSEADPSRTKLRGNHGCPRSLSPAIGVTADLDPLTRFENAIATFFTARAVERG